MKKKMKKILTALFALALALGIIPTVVLANGPSCADCIEHTTEVVSDTTNVVLPGGGNAVPVTFIHPAWTASIPGATWIWSVDPVASPTTDEYSIFEKSFNVAGDVTSAVLDIASDNSYKVWINGTLVGEDASENNFSSAGQDQYTATVISALQSGANTIKVEVKNWALGGGTIYTNPAGLLYKLVVNSKECPPRCCIGDVKVRNRNNATVINNVSVVANTGGNVAAGGSGGNGGSSGNTIAIGGSCQEQSVASFSDTTNTVVGDGNAVAIVPHPAWTASIPGATWIWKSAATAPNETVAFEKSFTVVGVVLSATLDIATDNSYAVFIDGTPVASDAADNNFQLATQDSYDLTASVTTGTHTLRIEVKNVGTYNPSSNPAGLLYKLVVNSKECPLGSIANGGSANGGNGGSNSGNITTGNASAKSSVVNRVNTTVTRVRR